MPLLCNLSGRFRCFIYWVLQEFYIMSEKRAVVLLSGGLDSATVLAIARAEGFSCYALSFDYGQRHRCELTAAANVARSLGAALHHTVR